jgi:hypothetical protein
MSQPNGTPLSDRTLLLALKRAIIEKFDESQWKELGFLVGNVELVEGHPRLLRSLYFRDSDYEYCVLSVLQQIIESNPENLQILVDFVGLEEWLRENYPSLYLRWIQQDAGNLHIANLMKSETRLRYLNQRSPHFEFPVELQDSLRKFKVDYPDPSKVAFLMMQFGTTPAHEKIVQAIRTTLSSHGLIALRADDKEYHDDLFPNVLTYIHGCGFGVAVFERIEADRFNPNVALEVGYMLALRKEVCLLKDRTLQNLHADLLGKLYKSFDPQNPDGTIPKQLKKWLSDKAKVRLDIEDDLPF